MNNTEMIKIDISGKSTKERLSKKQLRTIFAVWTFALLFMFSAISVYLQSLPVKVSFIDVGQGDSCLIRAGKNGTVLIDGGDKGAGIEIRDFLDYNNVRRLDGVFISHFHSDHVSGIEELIQDGFQIKRAFIPDVESDSDKKSEMMKLFMERGIEVIRVKSGDVMEIGKVKYNVLWPDSGAIAVAENNRSMVLKASYEESDVLFTGDIEMPVIEELNRRYGTLLCAEVLKYPHHGGEASASAEFLENCAPEFAVISVGINNTYDLPSDTVLECLGERGIPTLRTDRDGVIDVTLGKNGIKNIVHGNKWR